jgi:hypothetical protein
VYATIKVAGAGKATAYTPDGKRVGVFVSLQSAINALDKPGARR